MATEKVWRQLVRRSLGIPDIIGDELALAIVTDAVYTESNQEPRSTVPLEFRPHRPDGRSQEDIGQALWEAVVKLGVEGRLDEFLMERPGVEEMALRKHVIERANVALGKEIPMPPGMATPLLTPLRNFVKAHPFQDKAGRYFHDCSHSGAV